jgi:hypothetical protein
MSANYQTKKIKKHKIVVEQGYNFEFWIYNNKKELTKMNIK